MRTPYPILAAVLLMAFKTEASGNDAQAFTLEGTEFQEITIHIRGNKAVTAALSDAVDKGSTVTGVADFDSLSAVYGLMGIYREDAMSSGFYGHRFRLRFPSDSNVIVIAKGYGNLPAIQSVGTEGPVYSGNHIHGLGGSKHAGARIFTKVVSGTLSYVAFSGIGSLLYHSYIYDEPEEQAGPMEGVEVFFYGLVAGGAVGFPVGVTLVDPDDSLPRTLLAGVIPAAAGLYFFESEKSVASGFLLAWVYPPFISLAASELWRNPAEDRRTSFALIPTPIGGLSGITTLRF